MSLLVTLLLQTAFASELKIYRAGILYSSTALEMVYSPSTNADKEIYLRSVVHKDQDENTPQIYECVTTQKILAKYFKDETLLAMPQKLLFEKLWASNLIFNCQIQLGPILINYKNQLVNYYSGALVSAS